MDVPTLFWVLFLAFILLMLAIDLGVFNRRAHAPSLREASAWTATWVSLATLFGIGVTLVYGTERGLEFATGYLIEYALSVDNIFVFLLVFGAFGVPRAFQHRVLFWGILGALIMRGAMIALGATLLERFAWIEIVFGVILLVAAWRMLFGGGAEVDPAHNPLLRLARRFLPVTDGFRGERFVVREAGRLMLTPLFLVLLVVETTDLVFAVDSIPAVFAITREPFLVFTSNVFAILGLRSLYFLLAGIADRFVYLETGLGVVLGFVGVKLVLARWLHLPVWVSLIVIASVLTIAIVASLLSGRRDPELLEAEAKAGVVSAGAEE